MSETSVVFNLLVKDNASLAFNELRLQASRAFDVIAAKAFSFAKESIAAMEGSERAELLLTDAFAKFPKIADTNIDKLRELANELQRTTRFDDEAVKTGQAKLAMFNFTGKQIEQLTPLLADFAAKTGGDMATAAGVFGKAMLGQGRGLKQVGINFKDTGSAAGNYAELVDSLSAKVGGFALKDGKTYSAQMIILKNQYEELQEKIGGALVPVLLKLIPNVAKVVEFFQRNSDVLIKVLAVVGSLIGLIWLLNAAVRAYTTVQIALDIAMNANPVMLIVLAVIALIAGIYLLWQNSAGFRNFFIGMWQGIWGFLQAVGAWFSGPFVDSFVGAYHAVMDGAKTAADWVHQRWSDFINFFTGLGPRISNAASSMWSGLVSAFRGAVNMILRAWNALDFGIHIHLPSWAGGYGFDINDIIPDLPYLAMGGQVLATGAAVVHKGETVIPAGRGGGEVTVTFDFTGLDGAMATALRKLVRVEGGGNVQVALGH